MELCLIKFALLLSTHQDVCFRRDYFSSLHNHASEGACVETILKNTDDVINCWLHDKLDDGNFLMWCEENHLRLNI